MTTCSPPTAPSRVQAALRHERGNTPVVRATSCTLACSQIHIDPDSHKVGDQQSFGTLTPSQATMSTCLLFVTALEADHKAVNLLIHHLSDWEYNKGELAFSLVTTKNAYDLELPPEVKALDATPPSLDGTFDNSWSGASLKDVEDFCLDMIHTKDHENIAPSLFVVVDSAGFQAQNAILVEQAVGEEDEDFVMLDSFVKMRIPWAETYINWCGLSVANSDFDEMGERRPDSGEEEEPGGEQGWYDYYEGHATDLDEKQVKRKEKAFQRLKDEGRV